MATTKKFAAERKEQKLWDKDFERRMKDMKRRTFTIRIAEVGTNARGIHTISLTGTELLELQDSLRLEVESALKLAAPIYGMTGEANELPSGTFLTRVK
jgi:hypothetical protein